MSSTYLDTDFDDYDGAMEEEYEEWISSLPVAIQTAIAELEALDIRTDELEAFITFPQDMREHYFYQQYVALSASDKDEVLKDLKTTDIDPGWWEEVNNVVKNLNKTLKG